MDDPITSLIRIALATAAGLLLVLLARRGLRAATRQGRVSAQGRFIAMAAVKWLVIVLVTLTALHEIGIPLGTVWATISAALVLVAIGFVAVWSVLSNALCALFLVLFAPFRIGDHVTIVEPTTGKADEPGLSGKVVDITLLYTTLRPDPEQPTRIRVPNNVFFQKAVKCRPGETTTSLGQALFASESKRDGS